MLGRLLASAVMAVLVATPAAGHPRHHDPGPGVRLCRVVVQPQRRTAPHRPKVVIVPCPRRSVLAPGPGGRTPGLVVRPLPGPARAGPGGRRWH